MACKGCGLWADEQSKQSKGGGALGGARCTLVKVQAGEGASQNEVCGAGVDVGGADVLAVCGSCAGVSAPCEA